MKEINSVHNERIREWSKLQMKKYRDRTGLFLIEGEHLIEEALKAGCVCQLLLRQGLNHAFSHLEKTIAVSQEILDKLSSNQSSAAMIAVCRMPEFAAADWKRGVLLDGVQDPGNLGTIVRTAVSFGYEFLILSEDCADLYNEKCIRSTQGALFALPVYRASLATSIQRLKEAGFTVYGTALKKAVPLHQVLRKERFVLILGNEGQGISQEILAMTDQNIKIEMEQFESLNVAVAAGICLYELR